MKFYKLLSINYMSSIFIIYFYSNFTDLGLTNFGKMLANHLTLNTISLDFLWYF